MSKTVLLVALFVVMSLLVAACGGGNSPSNASKEAPKQEVTQKATETASTVISKELKQQKNPTGKTDLSKDEKLYDLEGMNRAVDNVVGRSGRNIEKYNESIKSDSPVRKVELLKQTANTARSFSRSIVLLWWFTSDDAKAFQSHHALLLTSLDTRAVAYDSLAQALESNNTAAASKAMATIEEAHAQSKQAEDGMRAVLKDIEGRVKAGK